MKKIIPPQDNNESKESSDLIHSNSLKKRTIPNLTTFNIQTIENLKEKLDSIKMENRQYDFTQSIQEVLNLYDIDDLHYNENIVFFVMQRKLKSFYLNLKQEQVKVKCVLNVVKNILMMTPI